MKNNFTHSNLFGPSGCLTQKAFFDYLSQKMPEHQMNQVEIHLSECLLCKESLENIQANPESEKQFIDFYQKYIGDFSQLKSNSSKKNNMRYLVYATSVAASIMLIISAYFLFLLPENQKSDKIALESFSASEKTSIEEESVDVTGSFTPGNESNIKLSDNKNTVTVTKEYSPSSNGFLNQINNTETIVMEVSEDEDIPETSISKNVYFLNENNLDQSKDKEDKAIGDKFLKERNNLVSYQEMTREGIEGSEIARTEAVTGKAMEQIVAGDTKKAEKPKKGIQPVMISGELYTAGISVFDQGLIFYNSGDYQNAIAIFQSILTSQKNNFAATYYLAMSYYMGGNYDIAMQHFDELIKNKKNNSFYENALWQKGQILEIKNMKKQAVDAYRDVIKHNGSLKDNAQLKIDELEGQK